VDEGTPAGNRVEPEEGSPGFESPSLRHDHFRRQLAPTTVFAFHAPIPQHFLCLLLWLALLLDSAKVGTVVAMLVKQDIFAPMESHPMAHAATLTVSPDGDLLCAFYAGAYETAPDQAIFLAHGHRQGNEWMWTKPHKLVDTNGKADGNPVLFVAPDGAVWLFFVTLQGRGWATALLFAMRSVDGRGRLGVNHSCFAPFKASCPAPSPSS
jgi:hypothetical protein